MVLRLDCMLWMKWWTSNKLVQCLCLRKDSTVQHHNAVSMKHKGRESKMERGLTNGFAMKETNWNYRNLNFLHWKALSNHLATDIDFPQRVSAYWANSCYANGAENCVLKTESYLLQGSTWFLISCVHINIKAKESSVLFSHHPVCFIFF